MRRIDLGDGALLELHEAWLTEPEAALSTLLVEVPWEARAIRLFGKPVMQPRLVAWLGDADAIYTYSGVRHVPRPLTPRLRELRARLVRELGVPFNGVLCNLYRDERDAMAMHSDSEPELGEAPVIASVSLGAVRPFVLRHKRGVARGKLDLSLPSGSLLVMRGSTQRLYRHGVPRVRGPLGPRVNLTFRHVLSGRVDTPLSSEDEP